MQLPPLDRANCFISSRLYFFIANNNLPSQLARTEENHRCYFSEKTGVPLRDRSLLIPLWQDYASTDLRFSNLLKTISGQLLVTNWTQRYEAEDRRTEAFL